jgi:NADP-dependent 3-hydroxy acid dehydrogenase YdfG
MGKLTGKTALITGGSSGIGLAIARAFLDDGCQVAITGRDEQKLRRAAERLNAGKRLQYWANDVGQPERVQKVVAEIGKNLGPIHILVNNAGMNIKGRAFRELTPQTWRQMVETNLDGAFYVTHAVLPQMLERREGLIIFVSSTAGKRANPVGGSSYAAAKFGMRALALCLGAEEKENGIRVSVIYPGEVDTPILEHRPKPVTAEQRQLILQPEDVAQAALFVATLPPRASVPELVIKPTTQLYI